MDRGDVEFHGFGFEERTTNGLGPQHGHEGDRFGGADEFGGGNQRLVLIGQRSDAVDVRGRAGVHEWSVVPERAIDQLGWRVLEEGSPCDGQTTHRLVAVGFQVLRG